MSPIAQYIVQTGITLLGIVLLGGLVVYASKKLGATTSGGPLRLRGRLPLEGRRVVYLVEVAGRVLVLGGSEAGLTKLGELGPDELPEGSANEPAGFAAVLGRALQRPSPRTPDSDREST